MKFKKCKKYTVVRFFIHSFYILNSEKFVSVDKPTTFGSRICSIFECLASNKHKLIYF